MNKLGEGYFYTFKLNITSGRQHPERIGAIFYLILFVSIFPYIFAYYGGRAFTTNELILEVLKYAVFSSLAIYFIFSFRFIYSKMQKAQYFILLLYFFIFTSRAIAGVYRKEGKGTKRMERNTQFSKVLAPICVTVGIMLTIILKRVTQSDNTSLFIGGVFFIIIGYIMYIGIAWTFMTFYCKLRFESFNPEISKKKPNPEMENNNNVFICNKDEESGDRK